MSRQSRTYSALRPVLMVVSTVAIVELLIHILFHVSKSEAWMSETAHAITDVVTLAIASLVALFLWVFKPLMLAERQALTEKIIKTERDRLQQYLDIAGTILVVVNRDQSVSLINKKGCDVLGYEQKDLVGRNWFEVAIPENVRDDMISIFNNRFLSGDLKSLEYFENSVVTRSGEERTVAWHNTILKDYQGAIVSTLSSGEDITERKQAEEKILRFSRVYSMMSSVNKAIVRTRTREELFGEVCRIAVEQGRFSMVWVGLLDPDTSGVVPIKHYGSEGGYLDNILISAADTEEGRGPTGLAVRSGVPFTCNDLERDPRILPWRNEALKRGYRSSGAFPLHLNGHIIGAISFYSAEPGFFNTEEASLLEGLADDVSHALEFMEKDRLHRMAEEQILQSKQDWEDTFNTITDMVTIHDKDFNIIRANKTAQQLLNLSLNDNFANKCFMMYHGTECAPQGCPSCSSLLTGKPCVSEMFSPHLNKFIEMRAIPRFNQQNQLVGLIHVARDITDRKKLEEQLFQSQKMEAVGQLAGGVAHDFNNILTAILGDAYILGMKLDTQSPLIQYVDDIRASSEKAAALTQSLLAFSRKQVINPKPMNLNTTVQRMQKLMARIVGEDISLKTVQTGPELMVMADNGQLEQVMVNLISNARDSMPQGGTLTISTGRKRRDDAYTAKYGFGKVGAYALLSVADTGAGMDKKTQERIFEPFFTTKEVGKGTGLGLSIIYGIIKQHNGFVDCFSAPGAGSVFNIYLPMVDQALIADDQIGAIVPDRGTEQILLAEDDPNVRKTTKAIIEEFGYRIIEAVDGEEAVRKFNDHRDTIQLLIMDAIMPRKNGKEAYDEIKSIKPDVKVLFLSGYSDDIIQKKGILDESLNFLPKPSSPVTLLSKIREILDR